MKISRTAWILLAVVTASLALFLYSYAGGKPAVHSVTLRWDPTPFATSYNVYRGTVSGGPYAKIGTAPGSPYVDTPVASRAVFYYAVTAVRAGKESAYSKEIRAAVP